MKVKQLKHDLYKAVELYQFADLTEKNKQTFNPPILFEAV